MNSQTPDEAAIRAIVESVAAFVDRGEFDALARLIAREFFLDYSSFLNGQAAAQTTPLDQMTEWAKVLPGFDRTRHALSNVVVNINGDEATSTADVTASHWIGNLFWEVVGRYDYELVKNPDEEWSITSMTFTLESESGTRDVFGPAMAAAESRKLERRKSVIGEKNKAAVVSFFENLENGDVREVVDLLAEDGVQINPYTGGVFPNGAKGKSELLNYWAPVLGKFESMKFPLDELLATEDSNVVFVQYRGELELKDNTGVHKNQYYSIFRFDNAGKIVDYVEIFDPIVAARSFGLLDQVK